MHKYATSFILSVAAVVLLFFGCTGENTVDPAMEDAVDIFLINSDPASGDSASASKFFTGRDSFGVALKVHVSVAESGTGSGSATHMGKISVEHHHQFDLDEFELTDENFSYTGTNGSYLSGRFEGTLQVTGDPDAYTIHGTLWVKDGRVKATKLPAEGRGTIEGTLYADGRFSYELDGWLLHHVAERSE